MGKVLKFHPHFLKDRTVCSDGILKEEASELVRRAAFLLKDSEKEDTSVLAFLLEDFADLLLEKEYRA
jgi:hypothetical protein